MSSENKVIPVKVSLRIRPLVTREKAYACTECLRTVDGQQVILGKDKAFTFDYVFSPTSPQVEVYETSVQPLLSALFKGYNATVLAYGQTGSGKTYTMGSGYAALCSATASLNQGENQNFDIENFDEVGIIPRVLNDLFQNIDEEQNKNKDIKFSVKVSFVEIYNEEIKDLFNLKPLSGGTAEPLNIREENNTIKVVNLSEICVTNAPTTIQLLEKGSSMRVVGGTAMNDQSSRSHAIFTITLEQSRGTNDLIKSKFHLVDLAGSERQSKTKAEGIRLREGININLGLLALGNVISILGEDNPSNKARHVPYRESKLTRILQDSLGGNSHTVMIACASPADSNMEETLNTLRYADRARKIKNKPFVNIDPQMAEICSLRQQLQELKTQIFQLTGGVNIRKDFCIENASELSNLKEENERLKAENLKLLSDLNRICNISRVNYERNIQLEQEKDDLKKKFDEIKSTLEKISQENNNNGPGDSLEASAIHATDKINSSKLLINELQSKLGEFEQLRDKENSKLISEEEMNCEEESTNEPAYKEHALRQAKMQVQLTEFDTELMRKQSLHQKMLENIKSEYNFDAGMQELKNKIEALEKEKEELHEMLRSADRKSVETKKDRLKSLEGEVMELKKKEREFSRMQKLKEENEKHCEKLRQEIQHIKSERVKLIKQMKADADLFRKYKQEKEKEVSQLKALERKRMVEINKLQEGNNRQELILRRKNDEIARIQKQLRDTCEKQKQVAEKRQQAFERKESSLIGDKLRQWVTQEVELSVALAEARINLNKLIEERKDTAAEVARLTEQLGQMSEDDEAAPAKRKCVQDEENGGQMSDDEHEPSSVTKQQVRQRIARLNEDIDCKTVQIDEINQMVVGGDQDERNKHLFNNIHGLLEAKVLLKHLYSTGVQYLLDLKLKQNQYELSSTSLNQELKETRKKFELIDQENIKLKKDFNYEKNDLINHYEQRILFLMKEVIRNADCSNDDRFHILRDTIKSLQNKKDCDNDESKKTRKSKENREFGSEDKKNRRDHRRTRIIRTTPLEPVPQNSGEFLMPPVPLKKCFDLADYSPSAAASPLSSNDDKEKDPDWAATPLKIRPRNRIYLKKSTKGLKRNSKSKTSLLVTNENEIGVINETFTSSSKLDL